MKERIAEKRFFDTDDASERYVAGRAFFHPLAVARLKSALGLSTLSDGLDVGCGTGLSTVAILAMVRNVIGIDPSRAMISRATQHENVSYQQGTAEQLAFEDGSFDIVSMCQVFHWIEPDLALPEISRVLRAAGYLVVYDNYFLGRSTDEGGFEDWFRQIFLERFPTPGRGPPTAGQDDLARFGFQPVYEDSSLNEISFTQPQLVNYFLSMSNVIARTAGSASVREARSWLLSETDQFFHKQRSIRIFHRCPTMVARRGARAGIRASPSADTYVRSRTFRSASNLI